MFRVVHNFGHFHERANRKMDEGGMGPAFFVFTNTHFFKTKMSIRNQHFIPYAFGDKGASPVKIHF
jgi:hypothetical protein